MSTNLAHKSTDASNLPVNVVSAQPSRVSECMAPFVIRRANRFRSAWNIVVAILLIYTATILPYRLCFIEFAIPETIPTSLGWSIIEWTIDGFFWLDLIAGFFFSYRDRTHKEITDWCMIVKRYLRGFFAVNLIACLPTEIMSPITKTIVGAFSDTRVDDENSVHKGVRLVRLQRMSRLARLMRLTRLSKLLVFFTENPVWRQLQSIRGVRVINLFWGLLYAVHIVACGWYLTAALHEDYEETWVARRSSDAAGDVSLLSEGPGLKWAHSMYFVLTVFTTVGFGDMSALTTGEIVYCCFTMLLGAVVQSIILSEVINIITSADQIARQVQEQTALVEEFSHHTNLKPDVATRLASWASNPHSAAYSIDGDRMKEVLMDSALPLSLMKQLPNGLYDGMLMQNKFLKILQGDRANPMPLQLPVLIALAAKMQIYGDKQVLSCGLDSNLNLNLVISGTFVHLARPAPKFRTSEDRQSFHFTPARPSTFSTPLDASDAEERGETDEEDVSFPLSPYQIFSGGNYFGEADIFLSQTDSCTSRHSAIRCESHGECLLMHKKDITSLVEDFPRAAEAWYHTASRRENHRQYLLLHLKMHRNVEELAASIIQRHARTLWLQKSRISEKGISAMAVETFGLQSSGFQSKPSGFQRSYAEHVPHYIDKLQGNFDKLRSEVRSDVDKLQCDVNNLKSCMTGIQSSLDTIVHALQVQPMKVTL